MVTRRYPQLGRSPTRRCTRETSVASASDVVLGEAGGPASPEGDACAAAALRLDWASRSDTPERATPRVLATAFTFHLPDPAMAAAICYFSGRPEHRNFNPASHSRVPNSTAEAGRLNRR